MSDQEKVWIEIPAPGPDDGKFIVNHAADFQRIRDEITAKLGQGAADRLASVRQASDGAIVAKFDSPLKALEEAAQRHGLLVPESPEPVAVEVDDEGYILAADGEILGHVKDTQTMIGVDVGKEGEYTTFLTGLPLPFTVADRASAEWVLARIADQEAKAAAVEMRRKAMNANMDAQAKKAQAKATWLRGRFGGELEAFARGELAASNGKSKKPSKTLTLDNGRVSFRTSPGTAKVTDRFKAIAWLRDRGLNEAIKVTEDVIVSKAVGVVEEMEKGSIVINGEEGHSVSRDVAGWLERSGPREVCRIVTGIEAGE